MDDTGADCDLSEDDILVRDLPDAALEAAGAGGARAAGFSVYMCTVVDCTG